MDDYHSQAILRAIVYCLSITKHRFEMGQRANSATITDIIRRQLAEASRSPIANVEELLPVLVAVYTDRLILASDNDDERKVEAAAEESMPKINYTIRSSQIVQCGLLPKDKRYFVLLIDDEEETKGRAVVEANQAQAATTAGTFHCCRCFVFLVDQNMARSHWAHQHVADRFGVVCTADPIEMSNCLEFPGLLYINFIFKIIFKFTTRANLRARTKEP